MTLVPFWIAAEGAGVVANPAFDVVIHALDSVGVLLLLRVPRLEHWTSRRQVSHMSHMPAAQVELVPTAPPIASNQEAAKAAGNSR